METIPVIPITDEVSKETSKYGHYVLHVKDLTYNPPTALVKRAVDFLRYQLNYIKIGWIFPSLREVSKDKQLDVPLHRVNFSTKSGEVTLIMGNHNERRQLIHLLSGRMKKGTFDGDIQLTGPGFKAAESYFYDHMAFVQSELLYSPGLTYLEMLRFAVELRLKAPAGASTKLAVEERVHELVQLFNLSSCKNHVMPAFPEERGESSGDMRRLAIAMEVADLPPLIVIDEPTKGLDVALSMNIMSCIHNLAKKGHIVVCSMSKPFAQEMEAIDRVVLLSEGWSIFTGSRNQIKPFFTSKEMGYELRKDVELTDFLIDVADGVERPANTRAAELPFIMQQKYEESDYCKSVPNYTDVFISAFDSRYFAAFGYGRLDEPIYALRRLITVTKRAIVTKVKDSEQFKFNIMAPIIVGLFYGYLNYNTGSYGNYCSSLMGLPYPQTTNVCGLFFFTCSFSFMVPHVSSHVVCQKVELFRYEQNSSITTSFAFIVASFLSEVPYTVVGSVIFSSLIYLLADLGQVIDDYYYFTQLIIMLGLLGIAGAYMFALLIRKELIIRDLLLVIMTLCALLSGFPVQLDSMPSYIASAAGINPIRWAFEGMMAWKLLMYEDGETYLTPFEFEAFDHNKAKSIINNFLWVTLAIAIVLTMKEPLLLKRVAESKTPKTTSMSRDSVDSMPEHMSESRSSLGLPRKSTRQSELVKPVLFMRESSVTNHVSAQLSINLSMAGEANTSHGPTIAFKDISYRVADDTSPGGCRVILNRVNGLFDWGKLSMVLGAAGSGKSSLMHILAGDTAPGAEITGKVYCNDTVVSTTEPLWQRCGFVPIHNEHLRDLTVKEVVKFAMLLRCHNRKGLAVVDDNVKKTIDILHLDSVQLKKTKFLNNGELKRVSIAEEMVHGPKLLYMDEPLTGISMGEVSILMNTFREMVNQDRTVIATVHQPSSDVFKLFDSLLLLSRGRVIYSGSVNHASTYFTQSPFQYNLATYNNPADFFADVSGGFVSDGKGEFVDSSILEHHFKQSEAYGRLRLRLKRLEVGTTPAAAGTTTNPLASRASDIESGSISMSSTPDLVVSIAADDDDDRKGMPIKTGGPKKPPSLSLLGLLLPFRELATIFSSFASMETALFKAYVLFYRSIFALSNRRQILVSSNFTHIGLAILFGWIMGDSSGQPGIYNTTAFFALSCMFLILTNIPIGFYMFNNHGVFLKESARELYPNLLKCLVADYPLYLLRAINAVLFFVVAWAMINQTVDPNTYSFAILFYITFVQTSVAMSEFVIFSSETKRNFYERITGLAFLNILFSGLLIKSSTLPTWISPWASSCSMVRWSMQGNFINLYDGSTYFATLPNGYSMYNAFLTLYGWGGKTKWYCYGMLVITYFIFKFFSLWTSGASALARKGGAKFRQIVAQGYEI